MSKIFQEDENDSFKYHKSIVAMLIPVSLLLSSVSRVYRLSTWAQSPNMSNMHMVITLAMWNLVLLEED